MSCLKKLTIYLVDLYGKRNSGLLMKPNGDFVDEDEGDDDDDVDDDDEIDAESIPIDVCLGINSISSSDSCCCLIVHEYENRLVKLIIMSFHSFI